MLRQSPEAVAHEVYGWFTTFYDRLAGLDGLNSTSDDWLRLRKKTIPAGWLLYLH